MRIQNIKHKTNRQWVTEWCMLGTCLVISLVLIYISQHFLSGFAQFVAICVLYIATFVEVIIFIARTIGVVMMLVFPDVKATDIKFGGDKIDLILQDGHIDSYMWATIRRIILTENLHGIYISSDQKTKTYQLPIQYKIIEENLDNLLATTTSIHLKKEKQWVESNQAELNPDKDPTGVKRSYVTAGSHHLGRGFFSGRTVYIDSANGVETIYYSRTE